MSQDLQIISQNGKVYKNIRAYHIAMGHAVRQTLLTFYKEVKDYAIKEVQQFYSTEFHGSEYYDNTYGMIASLMEDDDIDGAISYFIKGNWEGNAIFDIKIDWNQLDAHSNGYGHWGTYTDLDGVSVTNEWDELLENGLPKGILAVTGERHPSFNLGEKIENYINKNLDKKIQSALKKM